MDFSCTAIVDDVRQVYDYLQTLQGLILNMMLEDAINRDMTKVAIQDAVKMQTSSMYGKQPTSPKKKRSR